MKKNVGRSFFGCPHCLKGTRTWLDVALLKILEFDLNLCLILDATRTFLSKITCVPTNHTSSHTSSVMVNIRFPVIDVVKVETYNE